MRWRWRVGPLLTCAFGFGILVGGRPGCLDEVPQLLLCGLDALPGVGELAWKIFCLYVFKVIGTTGLIVPVTLKTYRTRLPKP